MAGNLITLTVPARDEFARTVRMTAVALLGRSNVDIDVLDDVRIAVEEAYIHACEIGGADDRITFEFDLRDDVLDVKVGPLTSKGDAAEDEHAGERYSRFILESVCDGFDTCEEDAATFLRITKRLTAA